MSPAAPRKPCRKPGCGILGLTPYCPAHTLVQKEEVKAKDKFRGTAHSRGYTSRWNAYSKQFRLEHPLCAMCEKEGFLELSECVDHIIPVTGPDDPLFWEPSNHQALSHKCHSKKTALEDGGFSNTKKGIDNGRIG